MNTYSEIHNEFRPRVIVWELAGIHDPESFSTHESLLTIDSIARVAKPIVVFTGPNLMERPDLHEIIAYGRALGLRIIVEARPEELTSEVLRQYAAFGPKVFRLILDGCIVENFETRYKQTPEFRALQDGIQRLKTAGYEIHLGATIKQINIRELAYYHDFALRSAAKGLYCHLSFEPDDVTTTERSELDDVIESIARMKSLSPANMYVSPQCVKYGPMRLSDESDEDGENIEYGVRAEWNHWCLAGKTFAYIGREGKVRLCAGHPMVCGELRTDGYNFKNIWETSEVFICLRKRELTCRGTREQFREPQATGPAGRPG
jgi:MoaA/NifB/PqqE/SkfB family radical SAM enzyme